MFIIQQKLTAGKININYWKNCFVIINFTTTFANLSKERFSFHALRKFYHYIITPININ